MADLILTVTIPDAMVARSKARSLANRPNTSEYNDQEWIEFQIKEFLKQCDKNGKRKLAMEAADNDDMFQE
jgi:hypothetical protein